MLEHDKAITAQEVAAAAHIPGRELANAVIVKLDDNLAMAVLRAGLFRGSLKDFERLVGPKVARISD